MSTYIRHEEVCGVGPWHWLEGDTGAWEGPSKEFAGLSELCLKHVRGHDMVLQAGGCLGMYPRLWAESFARVITVEPDPTNFEVLELNCPGDKYTRINAALVDDDVSVSALLYKFENCNVGMHSITKVDNGREHLIVPAITIDSLNLSALDLLQLDVEGSESFALRGGRKTIERFRPVISVETLDEPVRTLLAELGYHEVGRNSADTVFIG